MRIVILMVCMTFGHLLQAQNIYNNPGSNHGNRFEQLGTILPAPNEYRNASGAPGPKYYQQKVDYNIKCTLDEVNLILSGIEHITYHNNSPDELTFLWLQLDENQHSTVKNANYQSGSMLPKQATTDYLDGAMARKKDNGYGVVLTDVSANKMPLKYLINRTMMMLELPKPLKSGEKFEFDIAWSYKIVDRMDFFKFANARGGYEYFKEDDNYIFTIAQWFPRLCVYNDVDGWQNQQFTGRGEFTLCFGDYHVEMTVPSDHIVGATGECLNYQSVLKADQWAKWNTAQSAKEPLVIKSLNEVKVGMKNKSNKKQTWIFEAKNVRDFAWTSSRRLVWDAMPVLIEGKKVMCMSYYGPEAYPIYNKYSTKVIAHTIKTYSDFSIPYPYPVAQSVEAANGMEYPMICFNPGRAEEDGTYTEGAKNIAIQVIIHEVGHNFFPMIVNSDERQWTWMDEGINSYLEYLAEELWDDQWPSDSGPAYTIVDYMKGDKNTLEPIMTNSENIVQFGKNAYNKVATGLNILRESIVGRELFDKAFREYAHRWAFKHPTPADFFRTIEDASGEDLDWFWRGWFYSTDACDIGIDTIKHAVPNINATPKLSSDTVYIEKLEKALVNTFEDISKIRNKQDPNIKFAVDRDTSLRDFYWKYDRNFIKEDTNNYSVVVHPTTEAVGEDGKKYVQNHLYEMTLSNKGGLPMPLIIEWTYKDGSKELERIPAQIWRKNESKLTKVFVKDKEVASVQLDPYRETADIDESNNVWGKDMPPSKFDLFKQKKNVKQNSFPNPMQVMGSKEIRP